MRGPEHRNATVELLEVNNTHCGAGPLRHRIRHEFRTIRHMRGGEARGARAFGAQRGQCTTDDRGAG